MLLVAGGAGAISGGGVVATEKVKNVCFAEAGGAVGAPVFVNEQREMDAGFLAKHAGVVCVRQADGGKGRAFGFELVVVFAQLRDVLAAEDSTIMA